jgi:hypothetical protein
MPGIVELFDAIEYVIPRGLAFAKTRKTQCSEQQGSRTKKCYGVCTPTPYKVVVPRLRTPADCQPRTHP